MKVIATIAAITGLVLVIARGGLFEESRKLALQSAAREGRLGAVRRLLASGARPDSDDLAVAAVAGHAAVVRALLRAGCDPNATASRGVITPLLAASWGGHAEVVNALIAAGADVNARTRAGNTALLFAARRHDLALMQRLLCAGADPGATNRYGETVDALLHAQIASTPKFQ